MFYRAGAREFTLKFLITVTRTNFGERSGAPALLNMPQVILASILGSNKLDKSSPMY